ncbi:cell wall hydrolase [Sphingomonas spermidinifaciens]|uniref:Cell wall hydrolase n=1 Tax=Sphingomonas spermidinifaciens TaxID=1141889 RepID=A0A2A4BA21_9SPHN|nr:cell wall hydrolase [Sphingomonas spermidinifaciens]PCD04516.1 cell wall hydrolase [Sphingomonas spermidinifaciens]
MKSWARAAMFAAVTSCAGISVCVSTPGLATGVAGQVMNAPYPSQVPTPPSPIVPAEWTREEPADAETPVQTADFDTLRDAVAAQSVPGDMDRQLRCLATGIYYEAQGEPLHGQLAVAEVILNRTRSGRFPTDVCKVLTQPGQFSFVRGGRLPAVQSTKRAWHTAVAIAKVAKNDLWESKAGKALFFHARHVSPSWNRAKVAMLGNHIFYR